MPEGGSLGVVEAGEAGVVLPDGGSDETGDEPDSEAPPLPPRLPEVEEGELPAVCGGEIVLDDESK